MGLALPTSMTPPYHNFSLYRCHYGSNNFKKQEPKTNDEATTRRKSKSETAAKSNRRAHKVHVHAHINYNIGEQWYFFYLKKLASYTSPQWILKPMASTSILLLQREEMTFENRVHWHFLIN